MSKSVDIGQGGEYVIAFLRELSRLATVSRKAEGSWVSPAQTLWGAEDHKGRHS